MQRMHRNNVIRFLAGFSASVIAILLLSQLGIKGRAGPGRELQRRPVEDDRRDRRPRNIYLDLGANWGQTLDLFPELCGAALCSSMDEAYEVFSFEASPYISPFVEQLTHALNRHSEQPIPPIPPSGSTRDLRRLNQKQGSPCPTETNLLRKCYLDKHMDILRTLKPDPSLNSSSLISSRLDSAANSSHEKYTFIPAAVSDKDSWFAIKQSLMGLLIGGTSTFGKDPGFFGEGYLPTLYVRTVNLIKWLEVNFYQEDMIIVKMDIEGAEHDVIKSMIKTGTHKLIDVLAWECHSKGGDCGFLKKTLEQFTEIKVLVEGKNYHGWKD